MSAETVESGAVEEKAPRVTSKTIIASAVILFIFLSPLLWEREASPSPWLSTIVFDPLHLETVGGRTQSGGHIVDL